MKFAINCDFENIGGIIVLDYIDMEKAENRERVYKAMEEAFTQRPSQNKSSENIGLGID